MAYSLSEGFGAEIAIATLCLAKPYVRATAVQRCAYSVLCLESQSNTSRWLPGSPPKITPPIGRKRPRPHAPQPSGDAA